MIKNKIILISSFDKHKVVELGDPYSDICGNYIKIRSYIYFKNFQFNNSNEMYKILKPFIYYLYSSTNYKMFSRVFLRSNLLHIGNITFYYDSHDYESEYFKENSFEQCFYVNNSVCLNPDPDILKFNTKNFLKKYDEDLLKNIIFLNISMYRLAIRIETFYHHNYNDDVNFGKEIAIYEIIQRHRMLPEDNRNLTSDSTLIEIVESVRRNLLINLENEEENEEESEEDEEEEKKD